MNMKNIRGIVPAHPGAILREDVIPALKVTKVELAEDLGISRAALYAILSEKAAVSPEMAVRLGKLCGNGAEFWGRLQLQHDLWKAEQEVDVTGIPTRKAA